MQDIDFGTLIFIIISGVIFYQLRNVLGRCTGNERRHFDRHASRKQEIPATVTNIQEPGDAGIQSWVSAENKYRLIDDITANRPELNRGLREIKDADPGFDPFDFLQGARGAYEIIVTAYAAGDRTTLKKLVSEDVFQSFCEGLDLQEKKQEKVRFSFRGTEKAELLSAGIRQQEALITVLFSSKSLCATFNQEGDLIAGDPEKETEMHDIWTFTRDIRENDPNWKLALTEKEPG